MKNRASSHLLIILLIVIILLLWATSCRRTSRPASALAIPSPTQYELRLGKDVYQSYCIGCHGDSGAGDGFNAFNLDPHRSP